METPGYTALTGTVFHRVNTEKGWSGAPLLREGPNGRMPITAMHIAAAPKGIPRNVALSLGL